MHDYPIQSDRLELRLIGHNDVDEVQRCITDPRIYRMVAPISAGQSREQTVAWISESIRCRAVDTDYTYAIKHLAEFIGVVSLHRPNDEDSFELGYWLSVNAWGQGFATEAAEAVLEYHVTKSSLRRIISGYYADNPSSGRVLEKLGFCITGESSKVSAGRGGEFRHINMELIV